MGVFMTVEELVKQLTEFENHRQTNQYCLELFSFLVKSGMIDFMGGAYRQTFRNQILNGWLDKDGNICKLE
jgi:hypothetical protein